MRKSTDKKLGAILCAALVVGLLLFYIVAVFLIAWTDAVGDMAGWLALGIFFVMFGAIIIGVFLALRQRLKEIRGGEEEDAKKY